MKQTEIFELLSVPTNEGTKNHAGKLAQIFALCKAEKKNFTSVTAFECSMYFGRILERSWKGWFTDKPKEEVTGLKFEGEKKAAFHIEITLQTGFYAVTVPAEIYPAFAQLLGLQYESKAPEPANVLQSFTVSAEILPALHKAVKFVSNDDLRPALQSVCLDLESNRVQVIATDAHQMYMSKVFTTETTQYNKLLIPGKLIKKLPKKAAGPLLVEVLEGEKIRINGEVLELFTGASYVNWRVVVPDYEQSMTFDRVAMIEKTKATATHANKSTHQVNYHINGKIELRAQDVDFSFESITEMPYIKSSIPDFDIAFNAKMLVNVLSAFKADELQMYSAGVMNKPAIFTDGTDQVLLMPLWLHS